MRFALPLVVILLAPSLVVAAEPDVTLKKLNDHPSEFEGQTVRFRARVVGPATEKPGGFWLTVQAGMVTIEGDKVNKEGINILIRRRNNQQLLEKAEQVKDREATITVTIRKPRKTWFAIVSAIDIENTVARTPPNPPEAKEKAPPPTGPVEDWSLEQLLSRYDSAEPDNKVARELDKRSNSKRFLIFKKDRSVDVSSSAFLFKELRKGFSEREWYQVGGDLFKTYKVGVVPQELFDENPLYPGEPLRLDGTCEHTQRKWTDVSPIVRQILYLAITSSKELTIEKNADAQYVLDQLKDRNTAEAEKWVKERYPRAFLAYEEKKDHNQLPILKITFDPQKQGKAATQKGDKKETGKTGEKNH